MRRRYGTVWHREGGGEAQEAVENKCGRLCAGMCAEGDAAAAGVPTYEGAACVWHLGYTAALWLHTLSVRGRGADAVSQCGALKLKLL